MDKFVGTYKLESNKNFPALFEALGVPAELIEKVSAPGVKTEITKESDGTFTIASDTGIKITFTFGKEFKEPIGSISITGVANLDGNKVVVNSHLDSDPSRKLKRVYEFTDKGYTVTAEHNNVVATRAYSRQS